MIPDIHKPQANVDVEQQVIGSLLMFSKQAWSRLANAGGLTDADFYRDDHRRIFRTIAKTAEAGNDWDAIVISDALDKSNEAELVGGLAGLLELANSAISQAGIGVHTGILKDYTRRREQQAIAQELAAGADASVIADKLARLASASATAETKVISLQDALATRVAQPEFVVTPLQRGDVGIISGADGVGKSYLALALGMTIASGQSIGGIFPATGRPGKALYIAGEDRQADHVRRLQSVAKAARESGIDASNAQLDLVTLAGERMPLLACTAGGEYVKTTDYYRFLRMTENYDLVIIDPLRMFHDIPENDGVGMDKLVRLLVSTAMHNRQAIIVIHHASQGAILDSRDDHHSGRGATDFPAGCRSAWVLRGMSKDEAKSAGIDDDARRDWRVLVNGKASHGKEAGATWLTRRQDGVLVRAAYAPADLAEASRARIGVNKVKPKTEKGLDDGNFY